MNRPLTPFEINLHLMIQEFEAVGAYYLAKAFRELLWEMVNGRF